VARDGDADRCRAVALGILAGSWANPTSPAGAFDRDAIVRRAV